MTIDVVAAKKAVDDAQKAIASALSDDRALLADALDAGRHDPGTPHEDETRAQLVEAQRRLDAEEVRLMRARQSLHEALDAAEVLARCYPPCCLGK